MWEWLSSFFGAQVEEPTAGVVHCPQPRTRSAPLKPKDFHREIEKLDQLLAAHGVKMDSQVLPSLHQSLVQDRKIEAIKRIRTEGTPRLGLKEAKRIVDAFKH